MGSPASFGPENQAYLQPWGCGFVCVYLENCAVTPVIVVVADLQPVEFVDQSVAHQWPEGLPCAPPRDPKRPVSSDVGVEDTHRVERGLGALVCG